MTTVIAPTYKNQSIPTNSRGVSLVSVLIAVVIIGILGAMAYPKFVGTRDVTIENAKKANVSRMNELAATAITLGATTGAGSGFNIDTSSVTSAIGSLNTGFTVASVEVKLDPTLTNFASYKLSSSLSSSVVFDYNTGPSYMP